MSPSDVDQDVEATQLPHTLLDGILACLGGRDVDDRVAAVVDVGEHPGEPFGVATDAENRCTLA
jgi:hypothetical protein